MSIILVRKMVREGDPKMSTWFMDDPLTKNSRIKIFKFKF